MIGELVLSYYIIVE